MAALESTEPSPGDACPLGKLLLCQVRRLPEPADFHAELADRPYVPEVSELHGHDATAWNSSVPYIYMRQNCPTSMHGTELFQTERAAQLGQEWGRARS